MLDAGVARLLMLVHSKCASPSASTLIETARKNLAIKGLSRTNLPLLTSFS